MARDAMMPDDRIRIEYDAIPNGRGPGYGWIPMVWKNGRMEGSTWYEKGTDRDSAVEAAQWMAEQEADRYCGDWDVTVERRG